MVQEAKKCPDRYRQVAIRDFQLFLDGKFYGADELETLPDELRPSTISTPGNKQVVVFFGKDSKFSNHHYATFTVEGVAFTSIEQYLAFSRARISQRSDLAERAMASDDPVEAKRVLHLLREEPSQEEWETQRRDILFKGLLEKFSQNPDLREYLLSSEDRILGEASRNRVWGIGLTLTDRYKLNLRHWNGENLLGNTLMEVRQFLVSTSTSIASPATEVLQAQQDKSDQFSPANDSLVNQQRSEGPFANQQVDKGSPEDPAKPRQHNHGSASAPHDLNNQIAQDEQLKSQVGERRQQPATLKDPGESSMPQA